jgi:hypothetical protein
MGQRSVQCGCGAQFPLPELPPSVVHCPRCGDRISFGAPGEGSLKVREDIRESIRPLPPSQPYYPLVLLLSAGVLLAGVLIGGLVYFTRHEPSPNPLLEEGARGRRSRADEPVISIREIPVLPETPKSPPIQVDLSRVPPLIPERWPDAAGPVAKAQEISIRANLTGLVVTILALTGRLDEAREMEADLIREDGEIRGLLDPLAERPEIRSMRDYFRPGDELTGFGNLSLDRFRPMLFADGIRSWISEAQAGALGLATVVRDGRPRTFSMWFPEFDRDLTRRVIPPPKKRPAGS